MVTKKLIEKTKYLDNNSIKHIVINKLKQIDDKKISPREIFNSINDEVMNSSLSDKITNVEITDTKIVFYSKKSNIEKIYKLIGEYLNIYIEKEKIDLHYILQVSSTNSSVYVHLRRV